MKTYTRRCSGLPTYAANLDVASNYLLEQEDEIDPAIVATLEDVSEANVEAFKRDGFLVVEKAFSSEAVAEALAAVEDMVVGKNPAFDSACKRLHSSTTIYHFATVLVFHFTAPHHRIHAHDIVLTPLWLCIHTVRPPPVRSGTQCRRRRSRRRRWQ